MSELFHSLGIDPHVIAAQIIGFVLLWILLAKFLFKPVMGLMDSRQQDIKSVYDNAEAERVKAEEFRADYEKRLAGIEAEARTRIQTAVREAENTKDEIVADARTRAEDVLRRGQEDLAREREKILAQLREEVVNISLSAASKIIGESLDDTRHRKLVNDFVDKIGVAE